MAIAARDLSLLARCAKLAFRGPAGLNRAGEARLEKELLSQEGSGRRITIFIGRIHGQRWQRGKCLDDCPFLRGEVFFFRGLAGNLAESCCVTKMSW
jgi:hypothetical protein